MSKAAIPRLPILALDTNHTAGEGHKAFLCHRVMLSEAQSRRNYWGSEGPQVAPTIYSAPKALWCTRHRFWRQTAWAQVPFLLAGSLSSPFGFFLGQMGLVIAPASNNRGEGD